MSNILSSSERFASRPLVLATAAGVGVLMATTALWAHYGSTVFFEMIASGLAACF